MCFDRDKIDHAIGDIVTNIQSDFLREGLMIARPSHLDFALLENSKCTSDIHRTLKKAFDPSNVLQNPHYQFC